MAASRVSLQATMEALARKRQKEFEDQLKWKGQIDYYEKWNKCNTVYNHWNLPEFAEASLNQYKILKSTQKKQESLEERRNKLRKLFYEDELEYGMELTNSPRGGVKKTRSKIDDIPTEVLKNVHDGFKAAEEEKRRHEAEMKLYQQWKNDNPIIRNYEMSQQKPALKLAWLDQQIEKRMQEEKNEEEMRKFLEERDKAIKQEEELDKLDLEERAAKEKEFMSQIELQIKLFKIKEKEAEILKKEEEKMINKRQEIDDLLQKNEEVRKVRLEHDTAMFNLKQSKAKLRIKAMEIEKELERERQLMEEMIASRTVEQIEDEEKRNRTKESMKCFLDYIKEQQELESQRRKYINFIFDSEAKFIWEKQDRQWKKEEEARKKLLDDVVVEIKKQIEERLTQNLVKQKQMLKERQDMLEQIEEEDNKMKLTLEEYTQRKLQRKMELQKQIDEQKLLEYERKKEEERKQKEELERIQKEEDRIKQEIMKLQSRQYPQRRHHRRIIW